MNRRQVQAYARLVSAQDRYRLAHNESLDAYEAYLACRKHADEVGVDISDFSVQG